MGTGHHIPVEHQTAAHSGAQGHQQQTVHLPSSPLPALSQGSRVGVIGHPHRHAVQQLRKLLRHRHNAPAQVHAPVHRAVSAHRPRHAQTDAGNLVQGDILPPDPLRNLRQNVRPAVTGVRRDTAPAEQAAAAVEKTQFDGGAAYVHPVGQSVLVHRRSSLSGITFIIPQAAISSGKTHAFFAHPPFF